ncbi:hypothetical protein [Laribacter hongkongensis]
MRQTHGLVCSLLKLSGLDWRHPVSASSSGGKAP